MAGNEIGPKPEDASALAEALRDTVGTFVRGIRLQADTPTTSQSETLSLLDTNGPLSVARLAGLRNVRHQSMRLVVDQLARDGLVSKVADPTDGRSQLLSITAKGREHLSRSRALRTSRIAALIEERLSNEERQTLRAAIAILKRIS